MVKNSWLCLYLHLLICGCLLSLSPAACELREGKALPTVRIPLKFEGDAHGAKTPSYHHALLALALQKTQDRFGPCEPEPVDIYLPSVRLNLHSVEMGLVDAVATVSSHERERRLLPVRIPLLKGLMGYRLLFIRSGEQERFKAIETPRALRQLVFGQGSDWPDNEVMTANGIRVVTSNDHYTLVRMLEAKRFDAYPRGVQQIFGEHNALLTEKISIDPHLLLAYVSPIYFHVAKQNRALAQRLELGLRLALEDGSFDKLFYSHPQIRDALHSLNLAQRRVFYLCNPNIHPDTPLNDARYWFRAWPADLGCRRSNI